MGINKTTSTVTTSHVSGVKACEQETQRWYQSGAGQNAMQGVQTVVSDMSSQVFGYYALQVDAFLQPHNLLQDSRVSNCFVIAPTESQESTVDLVADAAALPIEFDNVDLVVASHVLDCTAVPHQVLREIERVLVPEGHCILISYNPFSWRGLSLCWKRLYKQEPLPAIYTTFRLKDWFTVLGFEVVDIRTTGFRQRKEESGRLLQRSAFLQKLVSHYHRLFGNVRLIHVRKTVSKQIPIKPRLRAKSLLKPGMAVNNGSVGKSINKTINRMEKGNVE